MIASGPTAPDASTYADALGVLERFGLLDRVPSSVRRHLEAGLRGEIAETPKPGDPAFDRVVNIVIGNNQLVVDAAAARSAALGLSHGGARARRPRRGEGTRALVRRLGARHEETERGRRSRPHASSQAARPR